MVKYGYLNIEACFDIEVSVSKSDRMRYQHDKRDQQSGKFTAKYPELTERLFVRLRPQVVTKLRQVCLQTNAGISEAVDAIIGEFVLKDEVSDLSGSQEFQQKETQETDKECDDSDMSQFIKNDM